MTSHPAPNIDKYYSCMNKVTQLKTYIAGMTKQMQQIKTKIDVAYPLLADEEKIHAAKPKSAWGYRSRMFSQRDVGVTYDIDKNLKDIKDECESLWDPLKSNITTKIDKIVENLEVTRDSGGEDSMFETNTEIFENLKEYICYITFQFKQIK